MVLGLSSDSNEKIIEIITGSYECCVRFVPLVYNGSFSSEISLMIPEHTSDSYNCCFRTFGLFPKLKLRKVCLCLNMLFLVCFFRKGFGLR